MRRWQCHKIVEAEQITDYYSGHQPTVRLVTGKLEEVPRDFTARGTPALGDYLVRYSDGYMSWSPRKIFEDGYTEITEKEAA